MGGVIPYLVRAYCDWIEDSGLTPHILIDCKKAGVNVPEGFEKNGKIVLNIGSSATQNRLITNNSISFKARFNGRAQKVVIPCTSVLTIYAQENGEGMFFGNKFETKNDKTDGPTLSILD